MSLKFKNRTIVSETLKITALSANQSFVLEGKFLTDTYLIKDGQSWPLAMSGINHSIIFNDKQRAVQV